MRPAIRVENLSKCYRIGTRTHPANRNLTEAVVEGARGLWRGLTGGKREEKEGDGNFWALKDVSFEVRPGEVVGIIGRNGAGKSTLLKVLSRIVEPTGGRCEVRGRMGSLLEVGTGFHPELTGRENVYLNGSILGMSRREIDRKFDEIVAFSEIERFIDTPVKRYSSGMYVRLAFAVAAHLEPEILVVDEVLAVGDAAFQNKCLAAMRTASRNGRTVLVVSHQFDVIRRLCNEAIWLEGGRVTEVGSVNEVVNGYFTATKSLTPAGETVDLTNVDRNGTGAARFLRLTYSDGHGSAPYSGGQLCLDLEVSAAENVVADSLAVTLYDHNGYKLLNADTIAHSQSLVFQVGRTTVRLLIHQVHLNPGRYRMGLWLARRPGTVFDQIEHAADVELAHPPTEELRPRADYDGAVRCAFDPVVLA